MSAGAAPAAPADALEVELEWLGDDRLRARAGANSFVMDSPPAAGPTPVETLALAFAGCMAMDVLAVVRKGRFELRGMSAKLSATRAAQPPRRLLSLRLHFSLSGEVPEDRVARAIELSREKYCSVWHSMRTDIELVTSFEVRESGDVDHQP